MDLKEYMLVVASRKARVLSNAYILKVTDMLVEFVENAHLSGSTPAILMHLVQDDYKLEFFSADFENSAYQVSSEGGKTLWLLDGIDMPPMLVKKMYKKFVFTAMGEFLNTHMFKACTKEDSVLLNGEKLEADNWYILKL